MPKILRAAISAPSDAVPRGQAAPAKVARRVKQRDVRSQLEATEPHRAKVADRRMMKGFLRTYCPSMAAEARQLAKCRKANRCLLEICPVCQKRFKIRAAAAVQNLVNDGEECTFVTIIPEKMRFDLAQLPGQDIGQIIGRIRKRIERSGVAGIPIFGSIDVSINVVDNQTAQAQIHLHLVCLAENTKAFQKIMRAAFKPENASARPFLFRRVRTFPNLATYLFKTAFYRRSSYNAAGGQMVSKQALRVEDKIVIARWLGGRPVGCRTFLRGIRRDGHKFRRLSQPKNVVG